MNGNGKLELYVIKDIVADDLGPVFQAVNEQVALRQYKQLMSKAIDVRDFELWRIGYIDGMMIESDICLIDVWQQKLSEV